MTVNVIQPQDSYKRIIIGSDKREQTHVLEKSEKPDNSLAHQEVAYRILSIGIFFASSATVAGGLAAILFDGWPVVLATILGGMLGIFTAALCQVSSEARSREAG